MAERAGGTITGFFLGSIAVHAAVLVALPGPGHERELPHAAALQVALLRGEDLALTPPELAAPPIPRSPRTEVRPVETPREFKDG
ncbi:MAG TPA: hypothetical protein VLA81_07025, partial [Burkholderiales bacterium]|nr:hypothetical protein [Burkholderiales bacterium]